MKRVEKELAASAGAAGVDAKASDGEEMENGRRMVDPRAIRRLGGRRPRKETIRWRAKPNDNLAEANSETDHHSSMKANGDLGDSKDGDYGVDLDNDKDDYDDDDVSSEYDDDDEDDDEDDEEFDDDY
ncbi:hypothetical protein HU200_013655 [Digitaria exilis]|uniref:Uncharacterized protein n=1 Tax=Digitaria exilis TaxID=1010633 RepID=A0A835KKU6_9POAL|nr:hypothetical protein HU200_013655 [Digitaria exilis]